VIRFSGLCTCGFGDVFVFCEGNADQIKSRDLAQHLIVKA
jgi:hypothetical protein